MDSAEFQPRVLRHFAGDHPSIDSDDDRLSPLGAILLVGTSVALWALIAALIVHFI